MTGDCLTFQYFLLCFKLPFVLGCLYQVFKLKNKSFSHTFKKISPLSIPIIVLYQFEMEQVREEVTCGQPLVTGSSSTYLGSDPLLTLSGFVTLGKLFNLAFSLVHKVKNNNKIYFSLFIEITLIKCFVNAEINVIILLLPSGVFSGVGIKASHVTSLFIKSYHLGVVN